MQTRRVLAALALPLVAFAVTACGSDEPTAQPTVTVTVDEQGEIIPEETTAPVVETSDDCWSDAGSTWKDEYNAIADPDEAVKVLDALPEPFTGCTAADRERLSYAKDLAARIHAH